MYNNVIQDSNVFQSQFLSLIHQLLAQILLVVMVLLYQIMKDIVCLMLVKLKFNHHQNAIETQIVLLIIVQTTFVQLLTLMKFVPLDKIIVEMD